MRRRDHLHDRLHPAGYALVRWVAGVPERLGLYPTEAAALAAPLVVAVTTTA
jgi:hypothetical protein